MKVVPLLIFWSLTFLQAGEHGQSLPSGCGDTRLAEAHVNSAAIQKTTDASSPSDPSSGSLGGSLWDEDEEDSLDDVFFDDGLLLSRWLLIRGRDALSSFAHGQHDFLGTPSHPHPLRC
jgi:hypothetical protein